MDRRIDHDDIDAALRRCGATWNAAQTHGLLAGHLATSGGDGGFQWLAQVLEGTRPDDALRVECEAQLSDLFAETYRQLAERQSEFRPLLPDDEHEATARAAALGHWCEGFLHGLVSTARSDELKARLAEEPLEEIIRDMLQITRATIETDDVEAEEAAYAELVEYLRVTAQLAYEELAEFRNAAEAPDEEQDTLH